MKNFYSPVAISGDITGCGIAGITGGTPGIADIGGTTPVGTAPAGMG